MEHDRKPVESETLGSEGMTKFVKQDAQDDGRNILRVVPRIDPAVRQDWPKKEEQSDVKPNRNAEHPTDAYRPIKNGAKPGKIHRSVRSSS
jgi:hypothetical protein